MPDNRITNQEYDNLLYHKRDIPLAKRADIAAKISKAKKKIAAMPIHPEVKKELDISTAEEVTNEEALEMIRHLKDIEISIAQRADALKDMLYAKHSMAKYYSKEDYPKLNQLLLEVYSVPGPFNAITEEGVNMTPELIECITNTATYSVDPPTTSQLADPKTLTEEIESKFPKKADLWPKLLWRLFYIFLYLFIKNIFAGMCKACDVLPENIPPIRGPVKDFVKSAANGILKGITIAANKVADLNLPEDDVDVCSDKELLEMEDPQEITGRLAELFADQSVGCKQCDPDCEPSFEDIETTKRILRELTKLQMSNKSNVSSDMSSTIVLHQLQNQLNGNKITLGKFEIAIEPSEGREAHVVDKVRGTLLAQLTIIGEHLKGIDLTISNLINLNFGPPMLKDFICCLIRLLFVQIVEEGPLGKAGTDFFNEGVKSLKGKARPSKNTIALLKMFDSVLSYLTSQAEYNALWMMPSYILSTEFLAAAFKKAMAETLSVFVEAVWHPVNERIQKTLDIPQIKVLAEICTPFGYMMNLMTCSFNLLIDKIYKLLAKQWVESNETMKSYDQYLNITLRVRNLKLFSKLLNLILDNLDEFSQFCDVNKLMTEDDIQKMSEMLAKEIPDDAIPEEFKDDDQSNGAKNPVTDPVVFEGDPATDGFDPTSFINSDLGRGKNGEFGELDIALSPMYVGEEELEKKMAVEVPVKDGKTVPFSAIIGCGNEFNEILRTELSALSEVRKKNTISHLKLG